MAIVDNREQNRFELEVDGHRAVALYRREGDRIIFTHSLVPPELEGRGIGSRLIAAALAQVRAEGLKVVAECPFVSAYIDKNPEVQDLLA